MIATSIISSTDERTIRVKRVTRKANINKIKNFYHLVSGKALGQLKTAKLQRKLDALDENIMVFEAIQDRLEIVAQSETLTKEENEINTCRMQHEDFRSGLYDLIQTKEAFNSAQSIPLKT